ncbi:MAG: hypothetical protein ACK559_40165, partial [bacterium]
MHGVVWLPCPRARLPSQRRAPLAQLPEPQFQPLALGLGTGLLHFQLELLLAELELAILLGLAPCLELRALEVLLDTLADPTHLLLP